MEESVVGFSFSKDIVCTNDDDDDDDDNDKCDGAL
jgi:hypothetical protein